ncbi:MAG TPA: hypothetical protein VFG79_09290 [Solirubrobacter sp.]|nr:hypothetical protein [Solirubrobacter sp.]
MRVLGIGPRDVLTLARQQRSARNVRGPVLVTGVLAEQLERELVAGGDPALVQTSGEPAEAAVVIRIVAGAATAEDERVLRVAARALVPVVAVQTADRSVRLPYVLAEDVVTCPPGSGFPVEAIANRVAAALGAQGPPLAASLPVLEDAVMRRTTTDGALSAAALAALGAGRGPRLPVLALSQARMRSGLAVARGAEQQEGGREAAEEIAVPLAAALGAGIAARTLVRRLPFRARLLEGLVAAGTTLGLGAVFRRLPLR